MALFKKDPPKACPKCGKADGWHILNNEGTVADYGDRFSERLQPGGYAGRVADLGDRSRETFSPGGSQGNGTRYQNSRTGVLTYHCDECGFEKTYHV